jgi:hypothetical protein
MNATAFHPLLGPLLRTVDLIPITAADLQPLLLPPELFAIPPGELFPNARDAQSALAGFLLLAGHWEASHRVSQDVASREGSYWHAIAHRIEPDSWNSNYWFRRVGPHPIFAPLCEQAAVLVVDSNVPWRLKPDWDPKLFLDFCDEARTQSNRDKGQLASQIHTLECRLLFEWCALKTKDF